MSEILLVEMIERMSVAVTMALILAQTATFRRLVQQRVTGRDQLLLTLFFGLIGILGTYAGIPVNDALANSRVVGVMAAGMIGGPKMGLAAGLIAGGHRYLLGGFTAGACALANICEGLLAGYIHRRCPTRPIPWWLALAAGMAGETLQMMIILLMARPFAAALALVQEIALPMIVVNSIGLAIFMQIMKMARDAQRKVGAEQSHKALEIATKTLPFLRRGLTADSAEATARIIFATAGYDAVAITDTERVLAFVGAEAAHHAVPGAGLTRATRHVLATGRIWVARNRQEIGCRCGDCRLASAVVVPLVRAGLVVGTLKLYYTRANAVGDADIVFAEGIAHLFSTQLELAEIDQQAKMAARAKLKALHAQINPHFLFNTLNTITSLIRTNPDLARELLLKLSTIFRYTLHKTGRNITIAEELTQVRAYLAIEQARHGPKLKVVEDIAPHLVNCLIPSLTIQPLVENAIKHGLGPKEEGGCVWLTVREGAEAALEIVIADDGVGMDLTRHHPLRQPGNEAIGLINVHERLRGQFGPAYGLTVESRPGHGTTVTMRVPRGLEEVDDCA
ncbi:signal transduction histidine kinase, LytS [Thermosinus carboxydivorans Nor1]|uniref:histidine kinase n=1 Tax=Thermosinus carboxydivorans Nor1 TaxID=401526 RepID=A1HNM4_9FIRM|nr:sensor histidine kinase [Thermosinus carboxydivorans]EAX48383.1 signal transduction histidine kinase, LytS [Thermosinus carboxydivorans Nor1]